jgi:predicted phosphodiesterase
VRLAILSDVHGNSAALSACISHIERLGADERVFLGDAVGYLPDSPGCLELLSSNGFICQKGNHEAMLLGELALPPEADRVYRLEQTKARLPPGYLAMLSRWPTMRVLEREGRNILVVHGTPASPLEGYGYPDSDLSDWSGLPYDAVFIGHTHRPFAQRIGRLLVGNVGSVGLPRDVGCLACFAIYDSVNDECVHYRVPIDVEHLLHQMSDEIHPAVRDCLRRRSRSFVGEVLT